MKDNTIINIETQIISKEKLLKNNYKLIQENVKSNEYLKEVLVKYEKYNETLIQEQKMQIEAFQSIHRHIDNILAENKTTLSKNELKNLNKEKKDILSEINKIK